MAVERWPTPQRTVVITKRQRFEFVRSLLPHAELTEELPRGTGWQLIAFGTGVIVPADLLRLWDGTVNFHAASPAYPGRDPHHWAAYDGATSFGATAHAIWPSVDAGPICGVVLLGVTPPQSPEHYRQIGEAALQALFTAWCSFPNGLSFGCGLSWSGKRRARADLLGMCDLRSLGSDEAERRRRAFAGFESHLIE